MKFEHKAIHSKRQSSANPNCGLPQTTSRSDSLQLCIESLPNNIRRIFAYTGVDSSNPNLKNTCAKLACDTGRDIAEAGMPGAPTDTRCAVSNPPQSWTNPMVTNNFGNNLYSNMTNTLRANELYSISGTIHRSDNEPSSWGIPALSSIGAKQYDVPETELCASGKLNATTARQIQCNLGLRTDCGSITPPTQAITATINPASTMIPTPNPNCDLPQTTSRSDSLQLCIESLPNNIRRIFAYTGVDSSNPNLKNTCAKLACDTGRDIAEAGMPGAPTDTRCAVSNPPQSWTNPMVTNNFGNNLYSNMTNTLRANELYSISGTIHRSDNEPSSWGIPALSSIGAKQYDVPETELCASGKLNATTARQIQCNLGLRTDCGSITPPTQAITATINPTPKLIPTLKHQHYVLSLATYSSSMLHMTTTSQSVKSTVAQWDWSTINSKPTQELKPLNSNVASNVILSFVIIIGIAVALAVVAAA